MQMVLVLTAMYLICGPAVPVQRNRLFTISKNTNCNYVCFDAMTNSSEECQRNRFISCYWQQPGRSTTKALSMLEKMAYGYTITPDTGNSFRMSFHRFPQQEIWLIRRDGVYRAMTCVDSNAIWLDDIHLVFRGRSLARPVERIELHGRDIRDNRAATYIICPITRYACAKSAAED